MELNVIKEVLGYHNSIQLVTMLFHIIQISSFAIGSALVITLLSLITETELENFKQILTRTISLILISVVVCISTGHLNKLYVENQETKFKNSIVYTYDEVFIPLEVKSVTIEDYTKELIIDKQIYNIKSHKDIEVTKTKGETQGLVLYKLNITSSTSEKDINERINDFNKNPIYILKEIVY